MKYEASSPDELIRAVKEQIPNILMSLKPEASEIFRRNVRSVIYGAYNPNVYDRRMNIGNKIYTQVSIGEDFSSYDFEITSYETANYMSTSNSYSFSYDHEGAFVHMLEVGNLGWWRKNFPRPVISVTQNSFNKGALNKAISKNIKKYIG